MSGKHGTKETKELLTCVIQLIIVGRNILADGRIGLGDLVTLGKTLIETLPKALRGITRIPAEIADLDATERQELADHVRSEFRFGRDRSRRVAANALTAGLAALAVMKDLKK